MRLVTRVSSAVVACLIASAALHAQSTQPAPATTAPRLVLVAGPLRLATGSPAPVEIVTFAIYADETGGVPLWQETQNVIFVGDGEYTVLLVSPLPDGLPLDIFTAKDARWVGTHVERPGEKEQVRVLLTSVPYA